VKIMRISNSETKSEEKGSTSETDKLARKISEFMAGSNVMLPAPPRIYRIAEVQHITGVSRTTLWRWVNSGCFPAQVRLGSRNIGWVSTDIDEWIENLPKVVEGVQ
jgi:prophage regulatory protein